MINVGITPLTVEEHEAIGNAAPDTVGLSFRLFRRLTRNFLLFVEARVFNCNSGLLGHGIDKPFGGRGKDTDLRMPEK